MLDVNRLPPADGLTPLLEKISSLKKPDKAS
jgi:hypothetical protein